MSSTVRITLTEEVEKTLQFLEQEYVALNRVEVIKLAISEFYNKVQSKKRIRSLSEIVKDLPPSNLSDEEAMEIANREIKLYRLGKENDKSNV